MDTGNKNGIHKCRLCGKRYVRANDCARHERYSCPEGMVGVSLHGVKIIRKDKES